MSDEESLSSDEILNLPESELREWIRKKRVELGIKPEPPTENAPESPSGGNISPLRPTGCAAAPCKSGRSSTGDFCFANRMHSMWTAKLTHKLHTLINPDSLPNSKYY